MNWASARALQWALSGKLFDSVAQGGLGVDPNAFHTSGYLTDSDGASMEEYQRHVLASQNRANYVANGVETPPPVASEASGEDPMGQLAAAAAVMQI